MTDFWENKKIIAYIALAHHTRFITPIMKKLASHGARIKYVIGQAERSQEITAIELGLDHSHIFDFNTPEDEHDIQKNYNGLKNTLARSLKTNFLLGILPVTVTDKTLYSTAVEYVGLKNLFKTEKPDLCFALHELNRWGKMFAFWAKKNNCPFITLQEGLTYGLDFGYSGHAQYATLNLVWGERVKKKMVSFEAPESKIIPVGNTHLTNEIAFQKNNHIRETKRKEYEIKNHLVALLILSSALPAPELFKPILESVSQDDDLKLIVKFHPACKRLQMDKWIGSIPELSKTNAYFIHTQESTYDLISMADVCVLCQRSTTGLESIALGKPLIKLDFAYSPDAPYSFVDQGVAAKMSAAELAKALTDKTDFSTFINKEKKDAFLRQELITTTGSIEKVCTVLKKVIQANTISQEPIKITDIKSEKKWSIIVQVPDRPDLFLAQLEAIAINSENQGSYETILLEPEKKSNEIIKILDSLQGNVKRIIIAENENPIVFLNTASINALGEHLIFIDKNLAPLKGWLESLNKGLSKYGTDKLFGARICNSQGTIASAGIVVDQNHTPISAYHRLQVDCPGVLKERNFQMVDHCVIISKSIFLKTGGLSPDAGIYLFLDLCLKAIKISNDPDAVVYLPDLKMIFLDDVYQKNNLNDSIYFYGRWNGCLWESEKKLYKEDGFTPTNLAQDKLASAIQSIR